ncbi:MAG: GNAT family N-acetyltransferase [Flavobacteriales bacterium]|nr:GNAT family N-acetyltransferase [Flavobacteriales bacterium]MCB9167546.1 GNAT family N-acetyltransferase [Flavobacteriales bacterium]
MTIRKIPVEDTLDLRQRVLRPHQSAADLVFTHDRDPDAFHLGAFAADMLIGVASFTPEAHEEVAGLRPYRLRGMAVRPEHRKKGVGAALMDTGRQEMAARGCDILWCNARTPAVAFYQRQGMRVIGPPFVIEGIGEHRAMVMVP